MKKQKNIVLFYLLIAIGLFVSAAFYKIKPENKETKRPNIIFLLTDDHRWNSLGIMGNKIIKTPNLDQLGKKGTVFKNAYVTTAICCVSRASMFRGQYMSRHKINDFVTNFSKPELENTYPLILRKSGYYTGFIGKFGVGNPKDQPKEAFDFWAGSDKPQPDYEMKDEKGDFIHHNDIVDRDIKNFFEKNDKTKPFCLSVSFKAPHIQDGDPRQFIPQQRFIHLYAKDSIDLPEKADPKYWNSFPDFFRTDQNIARERWYLQFANNKMYQESVRNYFRLIAGVDEVVGNLLKSLKDNGLSENTVIIFTSDNGHYLGEYGLTGKWYGHEESVRVPLIIYDPRNKSLQGKTANQFALNIDIAPTILKLAGNEPDKAMQGIDLVDMVANNKASRKEFFYEHTYLGTPRLPKVEGIIQKNMKYMLYTEHNYEELFDLKTDPDEKINQSKNVNYATILSKMRKKYDFWKKQVF